MFVGKELRDMAAARVLDAKSLLRAKRFDGAVYIVGYAVELKLKARVAAALFAKSGFPETEAEFQSLRDLKTHDLPKLLSLTNRKARIQARSKSEWSYFLDNWSPQARYRRVGKASAS